MEIKYEVKQSSIKGAGLGIFAMEDVTKGQLVWKFKKENHVFYYNEHSLRQKLLNMKFGDAQQYLSLIYNYDKDIVVHELDDGKYTNHSFNPNIFGAPNHDCYAVRDIKKGEELFENYVVEYGDKILFHGLMN